MRSQRMLSFVTLVLICYPINGVAKSILTYSDITFGVQEALYGIFHSEISYYESASSAEYVLSISLAQQNPIYAPLGMMGIKNSVASDLYVVGRYTNSPSERSDSTDGD